jgi:hypothetical protein
MCLAKALALFSVPLLRSCALREPTLDLGLAPAFSPTLT